MSTPLIVNGNLYNYPSSGTSPNWAEEATGWAQAVTDVLETVQGADDIVITTALLANNQNTPQNIAGLNFDPTQARGAIVTYSVNRFTDGVGGEERAEVGYLYCSYIASATAWRVAVAGGGSSGVDFSMTSLGQIQYTSDLQAGDNYNGTIVFKATSLPVVV